LNKSSTSDINSYYGVDLLKQISQSLDSKIGDIRKAGQYDYYKNTWEVLDKQIREGEVSASSVISIGGKMYLVGGNRRMAFYIGSGINPKIWKIDL
jgi:hypothetical protein